MEVGQRVSLRCWNGWCCDGSELVCVCMIVSVCVVFLFGWLRGCLQHQVETRCMTNPNNRAATSFTAKAWTSLKRHQERQQQAMKQYLHQAQPSPGQQARRKGSTKRRCARARAAPTRARRPRPPSVSEHRLMRTGVAAKHEVWGYATTQELVLFFHHGQVFSYSSCVAPVMQTTVISGAASNS